MLELFCMVGIGVNSKVKGVVYFAEVFCSSLSYWLLLLCLLALFFPAIFETDPLAKCHRICLYLYCVQFL